MTSIFQTSDSPEGRFQRLREVLGRSGGDEREGPGAQEESQSAEPQGTAEGPESPIPAPEREGEPSAVEANENMPADEIRRLAEHFTPRLTDGLEAFIRQLSLLLGPNQGRLQAMEITLSSLSNEVLQTNSELASLHGRVASLARVAGQLSTEVPQMQASLAKSEAAGQQIREEMNAFMAVQAGERRKEAELLAFAENTVRRWAEEIDSQQKSIEARLAVAEGAISEIAEKLEAAQQPLESLSGAVSRLNTLTSRFQEDQQRVEKRLNAQAEAIRGLHAADRLRVERQEELVATVQKLKDMVGGAEGLATLPADL